MRKAFKKILKDKPLDHFTRGVFADWLEENGFDDEALIEREKIVGLHKAKGLPQPEEPPDVYFRCAC